MSNIKIYKYDWIWDKVGITGFLNAKKRPLKRFENIAIFSNGAPKYYPIMEMRGMPTNKGRSSTNEKGKNVYGAYGPSDSYNNIYYPTDIIQFANAFKSENQHPTQKPVALLEYLIRTYTRAGETALDFTMGSGSTGVACVNTGRNFIGIEMNDEYFEIAKNRIETAEKNKQAQPELIPHDDIFLESPPTLF